MSAKVARITLGLPSCFVETRNPLTPFKLYSRFNQTENLYQVLTTAHPEVDLAPQVLLMVVIFNLFLLLLCVTFLRLTLILRTTSFKIHKF